MFTQNKRGFYSGQIIQNLIGVLVVVIIGCAVVLPVTVNVTEVAGLSGLQAQIVGWFSTFIAIGIMLVVVGIF